MENYIELKLLNTIPLFFKHVDKDIFLQMS